jgi:hypothetical protein
VTRLRARSVHIFVVNRSFTTQRRFALKQLSDFLTNPQYLSFAREVATMVTASQHRFFLTILGFSPSSPFCILTKY